MAKQRPIQIGCPAYQKLVPGTYDCDARGEYLLSPDGSFLVERTHCGHLAGRCVQTLCILHRHNRGHARSWFPSRLVASPLGKGGAGKAKPKSGRRREPAGPSPGTNGLDVLA